MQTFTGVCEVQLRIMTDVEQFPFCLKHTFPSKEIALICIAGEANLFGIRIQIRRSDHFQLVHVYGQSVGDPCHVLVHYGSSSCRWTVNALSTRIGRQKYSSPKLSEKSDLKQQHAPWHLLQAQYPQILLRLIPLCQSESPQ
jgi:hypothetical protein